MPLIDPIKENTALRNDGILGDIYTTRDPKHKEVTVQSTPGYATVEVQGKRPTQEDAFIYAELEETENVPGVNERKERIWSAIQSVADKFIRDNPSDNSGCTVSLSAISGDNLITATAGDAEAFVIIFDADGNPKACKQLNSEIHTGKNEEEKARIGAEHIQNGRVNGGIIGSIEVTRSIGDQSFRPHLISQPRIDVTNLTDLGVEEGDKVLLVQGCDGLTDASYQDTALYIMDTLSTVNDGKPGKASTYDLMHALAEKAITSPLQSDNLTVSAVVVKESNQPPANNGILGVFDGHGGRAAALYMSEHAVAECKRFYNMSSDEYEQNEFSATKNKEDYSRDTKEQASYPTYHQYPDGFFNEASNRDQILVRPGRSYDVSVVSFWDEKNQEIVNLNFDADPEEPQRLQRVDGKPLFKEDIEQLLNKKLFVNPPDSTLSYINENGRQEKKQTDELLKDYINYSAHTYDTNPELTDNERKILKEKNYGEIHDLLLANPENRHRLKVYLESEEFFEILNNRGNAVDGRPFRHTGYDPVYIIDDILETLEIEVPRDWKSKQHLQDYMQFKLSTQIHNYSTEDEASISQVQDDLLTEQQPAQDEANLKKDLLETFAKAIEDPQQQWNVGLGGKKISFDIDKTRTVTKSVPEHVARIYQECKSVTDDNSDARFKAVDKILEQSQSSKGLLKTILQKIDVLHLFSRTKETAETYKNFKSELQAIKDKSGHDETMLNDGDDNTRKPR